jgi:hypothetical protein
MTKMIFIVVCAIVLMTFRMSRAVHFMTIDLATFNIGASSIRCTFKTGKCDADNHKNQDWFGHASG